MGEVCLLVGMVLEKLRKILRTEPERIAQLVACRYGKQKDPGSNPAPLKYCSPVSNATCGE